MMITSLVGRKIQMQLNEELVTTVYCNSNGVRLFRQFVFDAEERVFPTEYLVVPRENCSMFEFPVNSLVFVCS